MAAKRRTAAPAAAKGPRRRAATPTRRVMEVPAMPQRARDAHKGSVGHVLVLAGSTHYTGAAVLAARAALRSGCGLVTLGCPESVRPVIQAQLLCEMSVPLADAAPGVFSSAAISEVLALAERCDALALGPGISLDAPAQAFAREVAVLAPLPTVIDADGLNALADRLPELAKARAPRILTPHPGEAGRLLGVSPRDVLRDREGAARELARRSAAVVVLKGAGSLVTDGEGVYENTTGNPGMATAGSGDVLTGVIASLLAQGIGPMEAAILGVHLHGLAGDLAAEEFGEHGMIASDLLDRLPRACMKLVRGA